MNAVFFKRLICVMTLVAFMVTSAAPVYAQSAIQLPAPGTMLGFSAKGDLALMSGIQIDLKNPFQCNFLIQRSQKVMNDAAKRIEYEKLIKYFLASLTIPNEDMWVNLSPYESDRIIPDHFGLTEMGRDLLAQDYLLKQLTASALYPDSELGKKYWAEVYQQAAAEFGTTDVPLDTFNKVWILPDKAVIYQKDNTAVIVESHLKVMLEADYLAMNRSSEAGPASRNVVRLNASEEIAQRVMREIVLPLLEKEVNEGENFASLRQVYSAMITATWFKKTLRESILGRVYADRNKVNGIDLNETGANTAIYEQYLESYQKGAFNLIREERDLLSEEMIPRKYFSGGMNAPTLDIAEIITDPAMLDPFQRAHLGGLDDAEQVKAILKDARDASQGVGAGGSSGVIEKMVRFLFAKKRLATLEVSPEDIQDIPKLDFFDPDYVKPIQAILQRNNGNPSDDDRKLEKNIRASITAAMSRSVVNQFQSFDPDVIDLKVTEILDQYGLKNDECGRDIRSAFESGSLFIAEKKQIGKMAEIHRILPINHPLTLKLQGYLNGMREEGMPPGKLYILVDGKEGVAEALGGSILISLSEIQKLQTVDEVVSILAHEQTHIEETMRGRFNSVLDKRMEETKADLWTRKKLARIGFNPDALKSALEKSVGLRSHQDAVHGDVSDRKLWIGVSTRFQDTDVTYLVKDPLSGQMIPSDWLLKDLQPTLEEQIGEYPVGRKLEKALLQIPLDRLNLLGDDLMSHSGKMDFVLKIVADRLQMSTQDPVSRHLWALAFFRNGLSLRDESMAKYLVDSLEQKKFMSELLSNKNLKEVLLKVANTVGPGQTLEEVSWVLMVMIKAVLSNETLSQDLFGSQKGSHEFFQNLQRLFLCLGPFCGRYLLAAVLQEVHKQRRTLVSRREGVKDSEMLKLIHKFMKDVPGWDEELVQTIFRSTNWFRQEWRDSELLEGELFKILNGGGPTDSQVVILSIRNRNAEALFNLSSWPAVVSEFRDSSIDKEAIDWLKEQIKSRMLQEKDWQVQFKFWHVLMDLIVMQAGDTQSEDHIREVLRIMEEPGLQDLFNKLPTKEISELFWPFRIQWGAEDISSRIRQEILKSSGVLVFQQRFINDINDIEGFDFAKAQELVRKAVNIFNTAYSQIKLQFIVGRTDAEAEWLMPIQEAYTKRVIQEIDKLDKNSLNRGVFKQIDNMLTEGALKEKVMNHLAQMLIKSLEKKELKGFIQDLVNQERMTIELADLISTERIKFYEDYKDFEDIVRVVMDSLGTSFKRKVSLLLMGDNFINQLNTSEDNKKFFSAAMQSQEDGALLQEMLAPLWYLHITSPRFFDGLNIAYRNGQAEIGGPNSGAFVPFNQFVKEVCSLSDAQKMLIMKKILIGPEGLLQSEEGRNKFVEIVRSRLPEGEGLEKVLQDILEASVSVLEEDEIFQAFVSPLLPLFLRESGVLKPLNEKQLKSAFHKIYTEWEFSQDEYFAFRSLFEIEEKKPSGHFYQEIVRFDQQINSHAVSKFGLDLDINSERDPQSNKSAERASATTIVLNVARNLGATGVRFLQVISQYMRLSPEQAEEFRKVYDENPGQNSFIAWSTLVQVAKEDPQVGEFLQQHKISLERVLGRGSLFTAFLIHVYLQDSEGQEYVKKMVLKVRNPNVISELKKVTDKSKKIILHMQQMNIRSSSVVSRMHSRMLKWIVRQGIKYSGISTTKKGKMAQKMLALMRWLESSASKKARNLEIAYAMMEQILGWNMGDLQDPNFSRLDPLYFAGHNNTKASNDVTVRIPSTDGLPNNAHVRLEEYVEGQTLNKNFKKKYVEATIEHFIRSLFRPLYLGPDGKPVFVTHSDIHPGNVMVSGENEITIIDRNYYLEFDEKEVGLLRSMLSGGQNITLLSDMVNYILDAPENKEKASNFSSSKRKELMSRIFAGVAVGSRDPMAVFNVISQEIVGEDMEVPLKLRIFLKEIFSLEGMLQRLPQPQASLAAYIERVAQQESGKEGIPLVTTDPAQAEVLNPGGIDLNEKHLDLEIRRDGNGMPLVFAEQPVWVTDIPGLVPEIVSISSFDAASLAVFSQ